MKIELYVNVIVGSLGGYPGPEKWFSVVPYGNFGTIGTMDDYYVDVADVTMGKTLHNGSVNGINYQYTEKRQIGSNTTS